MKGIYILLVHLRRSADVEIGSLGVLRFDKGWYAYVGSAMRGIEARVGRYFRIARKRRWHIDYLIDHGVIESLFILETSKRLECSVAASLSASLTGIPRFGCSDCRCGTHLFYHSDRDGIGDAVSETLMKFGRSHDRLGNERRSFAVPGVRIVYYSDRKG